MSCPVCGSNEHYVHGNRPQPPSQCPRCFGIVNHVDGCTGKPAEPPHEVPCKPCRGTGSVECKQCGGNGFTTTPEVRQCPHGNPLTTYCGSCDDDGWHAAAKQNALAQKPEMLNPRKCLRCGQLFDDYGSLCDACEAPEVPAPDDIYVVLSRTSEETIQAFVDSQSADKASDEPGLYALRYVPARVVGQLVQACEAAEKALKEDGWVADHWPRRELRAALKERT